MQTAIVVYFERAKNRASNRLGLWWDPGDVSHCWLMPFGEVGW